MWIRPFQRSRDPSVPGFVLPRGSGKRHPLSAPRRPLSVRRDPRRCAALRTADARLNSRRVMVVPPDLTTETVVKNRTTVTTGAQMRMEFVYLVFACMRPE